MPLERRAELLEAHARECHLVGDDDAALVSIERARDAWRALGDAAAEGRALRLMSGATWTLQRQAGPAIRLAEAAIELLEPLESSSELANVHAFRARLGRHAGERPAASEHVRRAVEIASALDRPEILAHTLAAVGALEAQLDGKLGLLDTSVALARDLDDPSCSWSRSPTSPTVSSCAVAMRRSTITWSKRWSFVSSATSTPSARYSS